MSDVVENNGIDAEDDFVIESVEESEIEPEESEETKESDDSKLETESKPTNKDGEDEEDGEDETVITVEGDAPLDEDKVEQKDAPEWVRKVRKDYKAAQAENRRLKAEMEALKASPVAPQEAMKEPELEDFDYDPVEFKAAWKKWDIKQKEAEAKQREAQAAQESQQQQWNERLQNYEKAKKSLKVREYEFYEDVVRDTLDDTQQAVILKVAKNPAAIVYAIGRNQARANELAKIKDPLDFAYELAKLESKVKVETRKAPLPEKKLGGTAPASGSRDDVLSRLEDEADRTGDRTKLNQYKRSLRKKS